MSFNKPVEETLETTVWEENSPHLLYSTSGELYIPPAKAFTDEQITQVIFDVWKSRPAGQSFSQGDVYVHLLQTSRNAAAWRVRFRYVDSRRLAYLIKQAGFVNINPGRGRKARYVMMDETTGCEAVCHG